MKYLSLISVVMFLTTLPAAAETWCQSENTFPAEKVEPTLVVFRVADINLRAGPGVRFYQVSVLAQVFEAKATRK